MWKIKILSPAKINLHLDISPPGANGFHPIRSLFVMVSLYDEMRIEEKDEGCVIISDLPVPEKENILYKTWLLCQKEGLYKKGLKIHLKKKIPHGAGLGGGSGNAASLLRVFYGLNPQIKPFSYWKIWLLIWEAMFPSLWIPRRLLYLGEGRLSRLLNH
jgi:4-diphosphocytidyl-2-C-methyl-D-erythritol kinase